jgi:hypothetical protein
MLTEHCVTKEKGCGLLVPHTFELLMLCPANLLDWVGWRGRAVSIDIQASDQLLCISLFSLYQRDRYAMFDGGVEATVGGVGGQGVMMGLTTMRRWRWYAYLLGNKPRTRACVCEKDNGKGCGFGVCVSRWMRWLR